MEQFSFAFTVFFMLLGPLKIIPAFGGLMRGKDLRFKRDTAIRAALVASALCAFVALAGGSLLGRYRISVDAVRLAGAIVLLVSALRSIFTRPDATGADAGTATPMQLAVSPVALPIIVPPAGIAVILLFMMFAPQYPGLGEAVAICVAAIMVLDFLVMYFIDHVMKAPGLKIALAVIGSVLLFVQVCIAMEMVLTSLKHLGAINS